MSFLCSLDNSLLKNVIIFLFGNQISKWHSFEKRAVFDLNFTFLATREKTQKFLQYISHFNTYKYFAHPIVLFCFVLFLFCFVLFFVFFLFCFVFCFLFFCFVLFLFLFCFVFLTYQFCKNYEFIMYGFFLVWLLMLILFCATLEQSINNRMVSKILVGMSATDIYLH